MAKRMMILLVLSRCQSEYRHFLFVTANFFSDIYLEIFDIIEHALMQKSRSPKISECCGECRAGRS
jgi:hypothetical protein